VALAQDCALTVPPNPLTATGLSTPYTMAVCTMQANPSFVQGSVIDMTTGAIYVYNPLVINAGDAPLVKPVVPALPAINVVGLWFGTNGATLTLVDNAGSLAQGMCVNGLTGSIFGQFAYCNAANYFLSANQLIAQGLVKPPPLGTAVDGLPCPTTRDFFLVDMDPSDNVVTDYLVNAAGQAAQNTAANRAATGITVTTKNGSDNRLLAIALDTAMVCTPWKVPDLAEVNSNLASLPLNELHAAAWQQAPIALVALSDPMTRVDGQPSLPKTNSYRTGVNQPLAAKAADADSVAFCNNYYYVAPARLLANEKQLINFPSADVAAANSLYSFLAMRYVQSFGPNGIDCGTLLNVRSPINLTMNANGVIVGATISPPVMPGNNNNGAAPLVSTTIIIAVVVGGVGGIIVLAVLIAGIRYYVKGRDTNRTYL